MTEGFRRAAALGASTAATAAGALFGAVGSASADTPHFVDGLQRHHCDGARGFWAWQWCHEGWERVWRHGDRDGRRNCDRD